MIKIFIVDDHALIREGLKLILTDGDGFEIVGEASNTNDALEKLKDLDCDIVLLDINLPGRDGLELIEAIRQIRPEIHQLAVSMYPEDQYAIRALKAGASGYITKDFERDQLVNAINTVIQRGKFISPAVAELLADSLEKSHNNHPHNNLSNRELEIFNKVAMGKSVRKIAEELSLSISAVNSYRTKVLEKLNVKSNVELTYYAIRNKLLI